MFTKIERLGENEFAVFSLDGASPTAKFKRGTFKFDAENQTLSIAGADPLGIPGPACLTEGTEILFHLYNAKTGAARPQFRVIKLEAVKNQENVLVARGTPKTPPKFTAEEGWHPKTYKFRVYATHPGVETDHPQPDWLKDHILKTRACWNRVSWLCREARRACFANVQDRLKSFRDDQLLPKIEEFNRPLRKDKLSFPKGMDRDYLDVGSFLRYTGYLKFLKAESKPFPEDLLASLEGLVAWLKRSIDYTPTNSFQRNFSTIFDAEAEHVGLLPMQARDLKASMQRVLKNRKTRKLGFDQGWPMIKHAEDRVDWIIKKHVDAAGVDVQSIYSENGAYGLSFGPAIPVERTARPNGLTKDGRRATLRNLHQVTIKINKKVQGTDSEETEKIPLTYTFAVLQHRAFPKECHLKEWSLVGKNGQLWLCLSLLVRHEKPVAVENVAPSEIAGIDLGWRTVGDNAVQIATVALPETKNILPITVHFEETYGRKSGISLPPTSSKEEFDADSVLCNEREKFKIKIGPSRWGRRNQRLEPAERGFEVTENIKNFVLGLKTRLLPTEEAKENVYRYLNLSESYVFTDTIEGIIHLQARRSLLAEMVKTMAVQMLDKKGPSWVTHAGSRGMRKLLTEETVPEDVKQLINKWVAIDDVFGIGYAFIWDRITVRRDKEYERVAHSIMRYLVSVT